MHLEILYEDEDLIAINKPPGLLVHKSKIAADTEEFALQILRNQIGQKVFPVHRIDRKTSGVLLFTKTHESVAKFQQALAEASTIKEYHAITRGYIQDDLHLNHPLKNEKNIIQSAETSFHCLKRTEINLPSGKHQTSRYSLIQAFPKTGRMHQIRKHLNHLRHPIIGDRPHGCNKQNKLFLEHFNLSQMMLHCYEISMLHPIKNIEIKINAPYFNEFKRIKSILFK